MNQLFDLTGRSAVVTGASTGIGAGMTLALASAGADILLVDHQAHDEVASKVRAMGRQAIEMVADLTGPGNPEKVVRNAIDHFGKIDILINNAGTIRRGPVVDLSEEDWDDVMALNAKVVFFLAQAAAREMIKRRYGKIVNIASLLSFQGGILVASYAASKGAVAQMTKAMANEWAPYGLTVNAIAPGYVKTANTKPLQDDHARSAAILERVPAGRWGTPEDIAGAAVFLASRASDFVNGHVLVVDGGWLSR